MPYGNYQQNIMQRLGFSPTGTPMTSPSPPFVGSAVGGYLGGLGRAYNQGASNAQGMPPWLAGGASVANKGMVDMASLISGTPGYDAIKDKGMNAFTNDVRENMMMRAVSPMMGTENIGGGSKGAAPMSNSQLEMSGREAFKAGNPVSSEQARVMADQSLGHLNAPAMANMSDTSFQQAVGASRPELTQAIQDFGNTGQASPMLTNYFNSFY